MDTSTRIILASGSPRRCELLQQTGYDFDVIVSGASEDAPAHLAPDYAAQFVARAKAHAVAATVDSAAVVLGADTMVVLDGRIFGKPADMADARAMLHALSGRTHHVATGVCLVMLDAHGSVCAEHSFVKITAVTFRTLDDAKIEAYLQTGEPFDKAGAYGIQGKGERLIDHIDGDYDNVVGLPVTDVRRALDAWLMPF